VGNKDAWDVLQQAASGSYVANGAGNVVPHLPVLAESPGAFAGDGVVRAGESCRKPDVSHASKAAAIEGGEIRPNWSFFQRPVCEARSKNFGCGDFPLNVTDWASSAQGQFDSEIESADSRAKADGI
jgi:hypothetical protein